MAGLVKDLRRTDCVRLSIAGKSTDDHSVMELFALNQTRMPDLSASAKARDDSKGKPFDVGKADAKAKAERIDNKDVEVKTRQPNAGSNKPDSIDRKSDLRKPKVEKVSAKELAQVTTQLADKLNASAFAATPTAAPVPASTKPPVSTTAAGETSKAPDQPVADVVSPTAADSVNLAELSAAARKPVLSWPPPPRSTVTPPTAKQVGLDRKAPAQDPLVDVSAPEVQPSAHEVPSPVANPMSRLTPDEIAAMIKRSGQKPVDAKSDVAPTFVQSTDVIQVQVTGVSTTVVGQTPDPSQILNAAADVFASSSAAGSQPPVSDPGVQVQPPAPGVQGKSDPKAVAKRAFGDDQPKTPSTTAAGSARERRHHEEGVSVLSQGGEDHPIFIKSGREKGDQMESPSDASPDSAATTEFTAPTVRQPVLSHSGNQSNDVKSPLTKADLNATIRQAADRIDLLAATRAKNGVVVHLQPAHLGSITLTVKSTGGAIETEISASNENVRTALEQNHSMLSHALEQKGYQLESVTVKAHADAAQTGSSTHNDHRQQAQQQQSQSQSAADHRMSYRSPGIGTSAAAASARYTSAKSTGVDYWI